MRFCSPRPATLSAHSPGATAKLPAWTSANFGTDNCAISPFVFILLRTLPFSVSPNLFVCHSYENNGGGVKLFPFRFTQSAVCEGSTSRSVHRPLDPCHPQANRQDSLIKDSGLPRPCRENSVPVGKNRTLGFSHPWIPIFLSSSLSTVNCRLSTLCSSASHESPVTNHASLFTSHEK